MPRPPIPDAPPDRTDQTLEHLPSIVVEGDDENTSVGDELPVAADKPLLFEDDEDDSTEVSLPTGR